MDYYNSTINSTTDGWCPSSCDNYLCWPRTKPGTNVTQKCPRSEGIIKSATAYRYCSPTGTWETKSSSNLSYTHYENCILPQLQDLLKMCEDFGESTCNQIGRITRCIEMVGLSFSLVSLLISLYIFFSYRVLKNNRTKIHKNLFISTLLQVIFRLVQYINQELDPSEKFLNKGYLFQMNIALLEYSKTAMFLWMFIEGLYLHNMITVTVFQEYNYIKIYCYVGWILPGVMTAVWLITMLMEDTTWEYYYFLSYYWILEGPRSAVIIINLLFLLNIIRVLVVKLRESHTSEIEQVRKAVRAAIFLLPLMGISHILFFHYKFNEAWKFAAWLFAAYFLGTFQGFFVAVLYCFLNGEVQTAIRNSFYLRMSLRNNDYTPCRNFAIISAVRENGTINNVKKTKWVLCCKYRRRSNDETEINLDDLNRRRDTTIITEFPLFATVSKKSSSRDNWTSKITVEESDTSLIQIPSNKD
ncbi:PDF receptor isoform X1 [Diorhabda sublineata]|uniref:PDF receptor isoform X1 n=1 Tax=Diorhabda sublineata TaxID=1163346 RepID=UPI0024E08175|nr:PDF receptor isoform X1 [Diorhabda sublineata]